VQRVIILSIVLVLSLSCARSKIWVSSDYKGKQFPTAELAAIVINDNIAISNSDDIERHLGEGSADSFIRYLAEVLPERVKNHGKFNRIILKDSTIEVKDKTKSIELGVGNTKKVSIPKEGVKIMIGSLQPDVIFFVDGLTSGRRVSQGGMGGPDGTSTSLQITAYFALWDNLNGRLITYGKAIGNNGIMFEISDETWNKTINELAKAMVANSPYVRK